MAELCAIIARRRHEKIFEEMAEAAQRGCGLLEIRLDYLNREPRLRDIVARKPCPIIATIRRRQDGGLWSGNEEKRRTLLRAAVVAGFDYVDIESDIAESMPRFNSAKRIISHHNMTGMPDDLGVLYGHLCDLDPDIVKIACKPSKGSETLDILALLLDAAKPTLAIGMGEWGVATRILGPCFGAPYTYASFNPLRLVAPGLLSVFELLDTYAFPQINRDAKVYGVIGDPIAHSLSPAVHNACFRELGINAVYVPFRVSGSDLDLFLKKLERFRPSALSVTIPHKYAVAAKGRTSDPLVKKTGAANTMVRKVDQWELYNTDGPAALESIMAAMPPDPESGLKSLADRNVLVLGTGGVAVAVAQTLADAGAIVSVSGRREQPTTALAGKIRCRAVDWEERFHALAEAIVNCTPLGMAPNLNGTAYHQSALREGMTVLDTVYNPENTILVRDARERGCHVATGVDMFVRQAEAQFQLFTGREPPPGLMASIVREEMSPARTMLRAARLRAGAPSA